MSKAEFGTKRLCGGCGAKFYDLLRTPIVCPKCATVLVPPEPPPVRVRRSMQDMRPKAMVPAAPVPATEVEEVEEADEGIEGESRGEVAVIEPDDSAEDDDGGVVRDIPKDRD